MNTERLREISDWLKAGAPERGGVAAFNMGEWQAESDCGTVCCIGGTACNWYGRNGEERRFGSLDGARDLLGLKYKEAIDLFYVNGENTDLEDITPAWAARCIDHLIATGVVDWEGTRNEPKS